MSATQPRHQDSPGGEPAVESAGTGYAGAARMPLSRGTRLGLVILLVAWSIHLAERFIPDDFVRLHLYLQRFASGHFWFWAAFDVLLIVLTALALVKGSNRCRLAAAGILVVTAFVADPILAVAHETERSRDIHPRGHTTPRRHPTGIHKGGERPHGHSPPR